MNSNISTKYICINCGSPVKELYKEYSPTVLKLSTCKNCNEISDKYIEYDPVIIMIDLVLLQKEAYRHFLYNTKFENHWKLTVLVQLMEAFSEWMFNTSKNGSLLSKDNNVNDELIFNETDLQFYIICLKIMWSTVVYNVTIYYLTLLFETCLKKHSEGIDIFIIIKSSTISSFGKFFLLPALIWSDHRGENLNILFVFIYTTLCQFLVHSVVCRFPIYLALLIIFVSNFMKIIAMDLFNSVFSSVINDK